MIDYFSYFTASQTRPELLKYLSAQDNSRDLEDNANDLIAKVNMFIDKIGWKGPYVVTSGWRPEGLNEKLGGSPHSKHLTCQAIDISDPSKTLGELCLVSLEQMADCGLYMESLATTHKSEIPLKRWVHLQTVAPGSGNRIFMP